MGDIERAIERLASWGDLPEIRALLMELLEAREELAELQGTQRAAIDEALRGATAAEPRQTCGSCQHWQRDDEPATEAGARPCGLDEERDPAPRHPASLCARPGCYEALGVAKTDPAPDSDSPPLKGVTQPADNLIRSEGGDDV